MVAEEIQAQTSLRERAKIDKKKVKKSPDITKKYSAYIKSMKMIVYASIKKKLKNIVDRLSKQYDFDVESVDFLKK